MNLRRLPLLLLLVLLPVPAQAHKHFMECFVGLSPEKEQAVAAHLSCGFRLVFTEADVIPTPPPPNGDLGKGTTTFRAAMNAGTEPAKGHDRTPTKRSLFLVGETVEYIAGRDSGEALDGWMIGLRYLTRGQSTIEPFVHGMVGRQRPSRRNTVTADDDATTEWSTVATVGGGVDLEISPSSRAVIVPVLRLQLDLVKSWAPGVDPYGRAMFGVSFRYEGYRSHK